MKIIQTHSSNYLNSNFSNKNSKQFQNGVKSKITTDCFIKTNNISFNGRDKFGFDVIEDDYEDCESNFDNTIKDELSIFDKTFHDDELFDWKRDKKEYFTKAKNEDDLPLANNLIPIESECVRKLSGYAPDTLSSEFAPYRTLVAKPWLIEEDLTNKNINEMRENYLTQTLLESTNYDYKLTNNIKKECRILRNGKYDVDNNLLYMAIGLYNNSGEWGDVESKIIDNIKIPVYGNVGGTLSTLALRRTRVCLKYGKENKDILEAIEDLKNKLDGVMQ